MLYSFPSLVDGFMPTNNRNGINSFKLLTAKRPGEMFEKIFKVLSIYLVENLKS